MEIASLSSTSIKIKGKQTTIIVDPSGKTAGDMVLRLTAFAEKLPVVEGSRLTVSGAGEYEIGGVKVSATGRKEALAYTIRMDGLDICVSTPEGLKSAGEKLKEHHIVVIHANSTVEGSAVTTLAPSAVVLYGEQTVAAAKELGKEVGKSSKYVTTLEKLPAEMEVVVLG